MVKEHKRRYLANLSKNLNNYYIILYIHDFSFDLSETVKAVIDNFCEALWTLWSIF